MTRPASDDTGASSPGPARADRKYLERDASIFQELEPGLLRVVYADGDDSRWRREGTTSMYRRIG
jgi:hypothetical protein